jgi:hypothetical protein
MSPTMPNQAKLASVTFAAVLALTAFGTGTALAASPTVQECEDAGGTYIKDGSTATCDFPEEKVSSPNANPDNNAQTTDRDDTGHGNLDNREQIVCSGPPGQQDPECP